MTRGWHFQYMREWIPSLGIRYHVAIDGISLWLVLLTTFITPIAVYASFGSIKTRIKELCFAFLLLQAAMLGAFVSLDLFLFYVFWELMLVPMYLMIGIWGGVDKIKAAYKFFLYTMTGSVLMLAAILYMVWQYTKLTGTPTFDYLALQRVLLAARRAEALLLGLRARVLHQGADVAVAHLAARRPRAGADRRLGHPGRRDAQARHLRVHALLPWGCSRARAGSAPPTWPASR